MGSDAIAMERGCSISGHECGCGCEFGYSIWTDETRNCEQTMYVGVLIKYETVSEKKIWKKRKGGEQDYEKIRSAGRKRTAPTQTVSELDPLGAFCQA